jgi:hypothetical protein
LIRRLMLVVAVAAPLLLATPAAFAADSSSELTVTADRKRITVPLGGKFSFRTTISNRGSTPASGLIAHLNVLDLTGNTYVDPEDWSTTRTRYLDPIPPGRSATITFSGQAVNHGSLGLYVAILDRQGTPRPPLTAPAIRLDVKARRTLNAEGIAPLAAGVPAVLVLLTLGVSFSRRFRRDGGS